jgi:thioredoxin
MAIISCPNCGTKNRVDVEAARQMQPVCGKCGAALDVTVAASDSKPITVTDATFAREVLNTRGVPILVDYWAEWCPPCRKVAPVLDELAAESQGRYRIAKLNIDENPRTAAHYNIRSIPTMLVFRDGAVVDRIVGAQPKTEIKKVLSTEC